MMEDILQEIFQLVDESIYIPSSPELIELEEIIDYKFPPELSKLVNRFNELNDKAECEMRRQLFLFAPRLGVRLALLDNP